MGRFTSEHILHILSLYFFSLSSSASLAFSAGLNFLEFTRTLPCPELSLVLCVVEEELAGLLDLLWLVVTEREVPDLGILAAGPEYILMFKVVEM